KYYSLTETGKLFLNELNTTWSDLQTAVKKVTREKTKK
ncbi:PadR family transcriptional regulator, partial [Flavobacteriaceae bacterium]|nr:PadR family transcriptional regulator [Flavobacteriaceae bacterium]